MFLLLISLSVSREQRIKIIDSNFNSVKHMLAGCSNDGEGGRMVTTSGCSVYVYQNNNVYALNYTGSYFGGAVHIVDQSSTITIQNNSFTSCKGKIRGGAIYLQPGTANIYFNTFVGCYVPDASGTSKIGGGAIGLGGSFSQHFNQIHLKGNEYSNNYAREVGGAVAFTFSLNAGGSALIEDEVFSGRYLTGGNRMSGAHFFIDSAPKVTIRNSTFEDISTEYNMQGGAIGVESYPELVVEKCAFINIIANKGSIFCLIKDEAPTVTFNDCSCENCACKTGSSDDAELIYTKNILNLNRCNFTTNGVAEKAQIVLYGQTTATLTRCNFKRSDNGIHIKKTGSGAVTVILNGDNCFSSPKVNAFDGSPTLNEDIESFDQCFPTPTFTISEEFIASFQFTPSVPSKKFTLSSYFHNSDMYSKSYYYMPTSRYSASSIFDLSEHFSSTGKFEISNQFIKTIKMSASDEMKESKEFSQSIFATKSTKFSCSNEYSISSYFFESAHFSKSSVFMETNNFISTADYSLSANLMKTQKYSNSNNFDLSNSFSQSNNFLGTKKFKQSVEFSVSNYYLLSGVYSESKDFWQTNKFSTSIKYEVSNLFSDSEKYITSDLFSVTKYFSKTDKYDETGLFEKSKVFSSSNNFYESSQYSSSKEFYETSNFEGSKAFSGSNSLEFSKPFSISGNFSRSIIYSALASHQESFKTANIITSYHREVETQSNASSFDTKLSSVDLRTATEIETSINTFKDSIGHIISSFTASQVKYQSSSYEKESSSNMVTARTTEETKTMINTIDASERKIASSNTNYLTNDHQSLIDILPPTTYSETQSDIKIHSQNLNEQSKDGEFISSITKENYPTHKTVDHTLMDSSEKQDIYTVTMTSICQISSHSKIITETGTNVAEDDKTQEVTNSDKQSKSFIKNEFVSSVNSDRIIDMKETQNSYNEVKSHSLSQNDQIESDKETETSIIPTIRHTSENLYEQSKEVEFLSSNDHSIEVQAPIETSEKDQHVRTQTLTTKTENQITGTRANIDTNDDTKTHEETDGEAKLTKTEMTADEIAIDTEVSSINETEQIEESTKGDVEEGQLDPTKSNVGMIVGVVIGVIVIVVVIALLVYFLLVKKSKYSSDSSLPDSSEIENETRLTNTNQLTIENSLSIEDEVAQNNDDLTSDYTYEEMKITDIINEGMLK